MPTYKAPADRGDRMEFDGKGIRLINGARLLPRAPSLFDHFLDTVAINTAAKFTQTETGTGTSHAVFVNSATVPGGAAVGVAGATTNNAQELGGNVAGWAPATMGSNSNLVFECRAKFVGDTTATDGDFYLGFANAKTYTSGLPYVLSTASAFTTSAPVEFAGLGYSSIPTSGAAFLTGGNPVVIVTEKNSVAGTVLSTGVVKDSNFHLYRVELDASANAAFYIDDAFVGSVAAATTAATALTPYINVVGKNSHFQTATVDYVYVGGDLV